MAEEMDKLEDGVKELNAGETASAEKTEFTGDEITARAHEAFVKKAQSRDVLAFSTTPMTTRQWLSQCLKETIELRAAPQQLPEVSFEGVASFLSEGKCSNVITLAGAGISTSAGIPDYRSLGTSLFETMKDKYQLSDVSDIFDAEYFKKNPEPFFERSKQFFQITPVPTPCHYFIRLLHEKGRLLRHYTQNIDTLERVAGLPADKVVEAHGTFYTAHCMDCQQLYPVHWLRERVMADQIPRCNKGRCLGVVRPDIVMYGEPLPPHFAEHVKKDFPQCDLLIIMGTSLVVQPFASLINKVKVSTPRLYINLDNGGMDQKDLAVIFGGGLLFDVPGNLTDVFKQGKCDDACTELADLAGWGKELQNLIQSEHKLLSKRATTTTTTTTTRKTKKPLATTTTPTTTNKHNRSSTTTTTAATTTATTNAAISTSTRPAKLVPPHATTAPRRQAVVTTEQKSGSRETVNTASGTEESK